MKRAFAVVALSSFLTVAAQSAESRARVYADAFHRTDAPNHPSTAAQVELGRALFFDPRLSGTGAVSCATCHNPSLRWGDGLPRAVGHGGKTLGRRTPTILNVAWGGPFMWDGRFDTLEQQALGPITSPDEMNLPVDEAITRLSAVEAYRSAFAAAFPTEGITEQTIGRAIAAFERGVVSAAAPFDRWVEGETEAISESARRGFVLFNTKAACVKCHSGWRFTDDSFHDIGLESADLGRGALIDYREFIPLQHAFKTPTLRDCDRRGAFFHDGSALTLEQVIEVYDRGGHTRRESLADEIKPLKLTPREKQDLIDFLATLSSPPEH